MLSTIRQSLLKEARNSPALLSDLAGLEQYIAESYDARSFIELLQNADDADASRFLIKRVNEFLLIANDGRIFTQNDFESLCRCAASSKSRETSIGYRGIGFKSVVAFAKIIHLFSGNLEATFSRERTAFEVPNATRVPLIRIPHTVEEEDRFYFAEAIDNLKKDGFNTIFVFSDLIAGNIETEFESFDSTALLFLRNIRQVELRTSVEMIFTASRKRIDNRSKHIRLTSSTGASLWSVIEKDGVSIAFSVDDNGIKRLAENEAVAHAFMPTHEATGFPFKINADLSTDPSRTRIILDERTKKGINQIANLIVDLIDEILSGSSPLFEEQMLKALIPFYDPRLAGFQKKSFKTELFNSIQCLAKVNFAEVKYRPAWLNPLDFEKLSTLIQIKSLARAFDNIEGLYPFLKFLGANEATLADLSPGLRNISPSILGSAEIAAYIANRHLTKQIDIAGIDNEWRIWPVDNIPLTLNEAANSKKLLDRKFLDLIVEKSVSLRQLKNLLSSLLSAGIAEILLPNDIIVSAKNAENTSNRDGYPGLRSYPVF